MSHVFRYDKLLINYSWTMIMTKRLWYEDLASPNILWHARFAF